MEAVTAVVTQAPISSMNVAQLKHYLTTELINPTLETLPDATKPECAAEYQTNIAMFTGNHKLSYVRFDAANSRFKCQVVIGHIMKDATPLMKTVHTLARALAVREIMICLADLNPDRGSLGKQKKRKAERVEQNAEKRQRDLERGKGSSDQERDLLLQYARDMKEHGIELLVMPDSRLADALFRTPEMVHTHGDDCWLQLQQKTTAVLKRDCQFQFGGTKGYSGMVVVCTYVGDDDKYAGSTWIEYGDALEAHDVSKLHVCISKVTGQILPTSVGKTLPTNFEGLVQRLKEECAKVASGEPTQLKTTALKDAWVPHGVNQKKEEHGICLYRELELEPNAIYSEYPAEQQGKTDLVIGGSESVGAQFKSVTKHTRNAGWHVNLANGNGRDGNGIRLRHNPYRNGDNGVYIFTLTPTNARGISREAHFWTVPESVMLDKGYVGEGAKEVLGLHMPDDLQVTRDKLAEDTSRFTAGWTKAYHTWHKL